MSQLQIFKNNLFQVAATIEHGQVLFDVERVAKCLGFTQLKNDKEYIRWERVNEYLPQNSPEVGKGDLIPEPLVYKLAFKASNEVAEQFQDWLAIEVIPSIRKTGSYKKDNIVPLNDKQSLIALMKLSAITAEETEELKQVTNQHSHKLQELEIKVEEQITLTSGEQRRVQKGVAHRVYEFTQDKQEAARLFREVYREIKDRFGVASYKDVKRRELQSALRYIENWIPRKVS
ncbi:ORF6C domain-containing protein [Cytobacillus sp. FJAT-53684]|uniref:ORF6C domain-containing protein n=1 Tax=Cytobacillus mangrovibacter TaxID=3299024 RepID=A0ABW6K4N8_9BACI